MTVFRTNTSGNQMWTWRSAVQGLRPYAPDGRYPVKRYFIVNRLFKDLAVGRLHRPDRDTIPHR